MYFDNTIWLLLVGVVITIWAQVKVSSAFNKYSKIASRQGLPAYQVARQILDYNGLSNIAVEQVAGNLTDHYDPSAKVLRLSQSVYRSPSIAAAGIAAHEVGHAIQDKEHYGPMKLRSILVPTAKIGSSLSWFLIIIGFLLSSFGLVQLGIIFFSFVVLFQLVTLPVEFNASNRAMAALEGGGFLSSEELAGTKKVLSAAALTYVAAALVGILQLLRLILIFGGGRDE